VIEVNTALCIQLKASCRTGTCSARTSGLARVLDDQRSVRLWPSRLPQPSQTSHPRARAPRGEAGNDLARRYPRLVDTRPARQSCTCNGRSIRRRRHRRRRRSRRFRLTAQSRARARVAATNSASTDRLRSARLPRLSRDPSEEHRWKTGRGTRRALLRWVRRHSRRRSPLRKGLRLAGWLSAGPSTDSCSAGVATRATHWSSTQSPHISPATNTTPRLCRRGTGFRRTTTSEYPRRSAQQPTESGRFSSRAFHRDPSVSHR
jgi:hypothetical protein